MPTKAYYEREVGRLRELLSRSTNARKLEEADRRASEYARQVGEMRDKWQAIEDARSRENVAHKQERARLEGELAAERQRAEGLEKQRDEVVTLLRRWRALFGPELDTLLGSTAAYADGAALFTATWSFRGGRSAVEVNRTYGKDASSASSPVVPNSASGAGQVRS